MLNYTLAHGDDDSQTVMQNAEGALVIQSHAPGDVEYRTPVLHVLRTRPPFRFGEPVQPEQLDFADRLLIALELLPFIVPEEDTGQTRFSVAANVALRARAAADSALLRAAREVTAEPRSVSMPWAANRQTFVFPADPLDRAAAQVAESEDCEREACD
jgi:hypothetical protein